MQTKRIIPCLDVKDGRVVKGIKFAELSDAGDPVEAAKRYEKEGADELAILDISASIEGRKTLLNLVEQTAREVFIPLTVGGGARSLEDINNLLRAGADKVSINTAAVENPDLIKEASEKFGSQCIVVAIDAKKVNEDYLVFTHGGSRATGIVALQWAKKMVHNGAGEILLTSMDRDGTKSGFDLELTRLIADAVSVPVIASGGVGTLEHLYDGFVQGHASAVLAASIFHFGEYSIREVKEYLKTRGVNMRMT